MNNFNWLGGYVEVDVNGFPWAFLENHYFCFLGIDFLSIHVLQYEERVFKQFCNPVLDLDRMIKSSAYNSEFIFVPFGRTNGSDSVFSNKYGKLFI